MIILLEKGGPLIWLLLACSLICLAVFFERLLYLHRCQTHVGELLGGIASLLQGSRWGEALQESAGTPGPVARVIHVGLLRRHHDRQQLKEIVQEAGQLEVPRLERHLGILVAVAYIAPLLGLLGTVLGLVDTFVRMSEVQGYASLPDISRGLYASFITSAVGLAVAVPAYLFYLYLHSQVKALMHDMERGGIEIINLIDDHRQLPASSSVVSLQDSLSNSREPKERRPPGSSRRA
jgi:biopolymer transport protein ExbB